MTAKSSKTTTTARTTIATPKHHDCSAQYATADTVACGLAAVGAVLSSFSRRRDRTTGVSVATSPYKSTTPDALMVAMVRPSLMADSTDVRWALLLHAIAAVAIKLPTTN